MVTFSRLNSNTRFALGWYSIDNSGSSAFGSEETVAPSSGLGVDFEGLGSQGVEGSDLDEVLLFSGNTGELDGPLGSGLSVEGWRPWNTRRQREGRADALFVGSVTPVDTGFFFALFEGPEIAWVGSETPLDTSFFFQELQILFRSVSNSSERVVTVNDTGMIGRFDDDEPHSDGRIDLLSSEIWQVLLQDSVS